MLGRWDDHNGRQKLRNTLMFEEIGHESTFIVGKKHTHMGVLALFLGPMIFGFTCSSI